MRIMVDGIVYVFQRCAAQLNTQQRMSTIKATLPNGNVGSQALSGKASEAESDFCLVESFACWSAKPRTQL